MLVRSNHRNKPSPLQPHENTSTNRPATSGDRLPVARAAMSWHRPNSGTGQRQVWRWRCGRFGWQCLNLTVGWLRQLHQQHRRCRLAAALGVASRSELQCQCRPAGRRTESEFRSTFQHIAKCECTAATGRWTEPQRELQHHGHGAKPKHGLTNPGPGPRPADERSHRCTTTRPARAAYECGHGCPASHSAWTTGQWRDSGPAGRQSRTARERSLRRSGGIAARSAGQWKRFAAAAGSGDCAKFVWSPGPAPNFGGSAELC